MTPISCTFTGVGELTSIDALAAISEANPSVEWGFLYSAKRQGLPGRHPSVSFLQFAFDCLPSNVAVAMHVCGHGVDDMLKGEHTITELIRTVGARGGRIQLNFNARAGNISLDRLKAHLEQNRHVQFITQHNDANVDVWKALRGCSNHAVLFDMSGGRGLSPEGWPAPLEGVPCGYAGGLGPDNLASELRRIVEVSGALPSWIDMEGHIRDVNDQFNLQAVAECLNVLEENSEMPGTKHHNTDASINIDRSSQTSAT